MLPKSLDLSRNTPMGKGMVAGPGVGNTTGVAQPTASSINNAAITMSVVPNSRCDLLMGYSN
jgi:hypothetical protein